MSADAKVNDSDNRNETMERSSYAPNSNKRIDYRNPDAKKTFSQLKKRFT